MGQLFKRFKRYNNRLSTFLNQSENYSNYSTMTGLKIAIILFAIAMICATANAAPHDMEECLKKWKACNGDMECVLRVAKECGVVPIPVNGQRRRVRETAPEDLEECAKKMKACNGNLECVLRVMKECAIECNGAICN